MNGTRAVIQTTKKLEGDVMVPGSKSQTVRAFVVALLAKGVSRIHGVSLSDDTEAVILACRAFGAKIDEIPECGCAGSFYNQNGLFEVKNEGKSVRAHTQRCFVVESGGPPFEVTGPVFTGDSGITTHFVLPLLGLTRSPEKVKVFDVGNQMRQRGVERFFGTLRRLGMEISEGDDNGWPLGVSGKLEGGKTEVWGGTSQYVSALLLCGMYSEHGATLTVPELCEKSYVEMTLEWAAPCVEHSVRTGRNCGRLKDTFTLLPQKKYAPFEYAVPGDFSSAAAIMAAAALREGEVRLHGLHMNDAQPDKALVEILRKMGADIMVEPLQGGEGPCVVTVTGRGGKGLRGVEIDANNVPDLVPILAVLGTQATGETRILNVAHAREKETDRVHSMALELRKMGANVEELKEGLLVRGGSGLRGAEVDGHGDHRTVMALAVAGMVANGETVIDGAECVNKTYPAFWDDMKRLGMAHDFA